MPTRPPRHSDDRASAHPDAEVVESGDVFFFYRPKVETEDPDGLGDVQRFHMVLRPEKGAPARLITIGRKHLPEVEEHERVWGFVEKAAKNAQELRRELDERHYATRTRGTRNQPAARPAGEGVYALVRDGRALYLAYELELPERPGPVQKALNIPPRASFALSIKNPERGSPSRAGLGPEREAHYRKDLQKEFRGRRFATEDPHLLDVEGAEFVLVGARLDPEAELGIELPAEHEAVDTAEVFRRLRLDRGGRPIEPLTRGEWA